MGKAVTALEHAKRDDDLLSYLFIDMWMYRRLQEMSRKMQRDGFKVPNFDWDPIYQIFLAVQQGELTTKEAVPLLLRKDPISSLAMKKRNAKTIEHLRAHIERYLELVVPDCAFSLFRTNRFLPRAKPKTGYDFSLSPMPTPASTPQPADASQASTSQSMEATPSSQPAQAPLRPLDLGVRAERDFEVNEFVRLFGSAADITDEQDEEMQMDTAQLKADFSVLWNPNKRCSQLLMGPSRFINHDCNNNVELMRNGKHLAFKVIRPIKKGQEILSYYGDEYFGPDNDWCRCATCKHNCKGDFKHLAGRLKRSRTPQDGERATRSGKIHGPVAKKIKIEPEIKGTRSSSRRATVKVSRRSLKQAQRDKIKAEERRLEREEMRSSRSRSPSESSEDSEGETSTAMTRESFYAQLEEAELTDLSGSDQEEEHNNGATGSVREAHQQSEKQETETKIGEQTTERVKVEAKTQALSVMVPAIDKNMPIPSGSDTPTESLPGTPCTGRSTPRITFKFEAFEPKLPAQPATSEPLAKNGVSHPSPLGLQAKALSANGSQAPSSEADLAGLEAIYGEELTSQG